MIMETEKQFSSYIHKAVNDARMMAMEMQHEFLTPEHLLLSFLSQKPFIKALKSLSIPSSRIRDGVMAYLNSLDKTTADDLEDEEETPLVSVQFEELLNDAYSTCLTSSARGCTVAIMIQSLLNLKDSVAAATLLQACENNKGELLNALIANYSDSEFFIGEDMGGTHTSDYSSDVEEIQRMEKEADDKASTEWRDYVVCLNDSTGNRNPLIGREKELERTIQVLCRKDKNNPLHIGEPGVGKTSIVYGLADLINRGDIPDCLKGARIYRVDLSALIAGTQFRGDFEKRVKLIMDGLAAEENAIAYFDEIHNLVGTGAIGESSMDASNLLKPYLEEGKIRFIGSTTYDEYNRHLSKSKGFERRFQRIDIEEPSVEETVKILRHLKANYESFHNVTYDDDALGFAAEAGSRYITDRFLPDKAIDIIDEAGAYRKLHPSANGDAVVDKALVSLILSKICKVENLKIEEDNGSLENLEQRISSVIFGQDEAVKSVTEAVLMAKAGLIDDNKPLASLLFVGPTGVGKTEVAKVLAEELGIELLRFDMSEYAEKHTVAKLIGSPAGYVGYDDGGLLTDAVRKSPNCVLLLDEIEKAHPDIYNILLQVMDYARLTDNKGRHADFRNVVIIMTSNAGAQFASRAKVGFANKTTSGEAMLSQVKKTFKPEFINRLSAIVVFNEMNLDMASMILNKKLDQLRMRLKEKNVTLHLDEAARNYILSAGFTPEYGARELERILSSRLKPLLTREILFGQLKHGGEAHLTVKDNSLCLI